MTLIGLHVRQYMYVLFGKVHIYIQKSYFTLVCHVQFFQNMQWCCREPHQFTEILIINVDENTSVMHGTLDKLLLNATSVSDFKNTLRKKHNLSTALRAQNSQKKYPPYCAVINRIININLPLMIFIRMHFQFHNKYLICSIMSIIYVQIASFVRALDKQIQTRIQVQLDEKFKKLYYRSKKFVKLSIESIFRMCLS